MRNQLGAPAFLTNRAIYLFWHISQRMKLTERTRTTYLNVHPSRLKEETFHSFLH